MKLTPLNFSIALFGISLLIAPTAFAAALGAGQQFVPGEVLVKFKSTVSTQARISAVSTLGGSVSNNPNAGLVQVKLAAGQSVQASVASYLGNPAVESAQPNYIYHIAKVPNDTSYAEQWALHNTGQPVTSATYTTTNPVAGADMDMQPAWDHITDCSSVIVAVVDSGVNYNQQDLTANMWNGGTTYPNHGYNFTAEGLANDPMDLNGHGTHVAGIIGAVGNNTQGVSGVCWKATIMAVRAIDATGAGTTATITAGINFAVANGAKVINLSLGGGSAVDPAYQNAIINAQSHDVVVVVAAGNETTNNDITASYPCNFTEANLLCVAALDQADALATFSNWGVNSVDVGAPGTNILSTYAGTTLSGYDPLTTGWLRTGFGYGNTTPGNYGTPAPATPNCTGGVCTSLNFPAVASWPTGTAPANTDARVYATYDTSLYDSVTLDVFGAAHVVPDGGAGGAAIALSTAGTDPFAVASPTYVPGASFAATETVPATSPVFSAMPTLSLVGCNKSTTCSIGFQLKTGATTTNLGMSIASFVLNFLTLNNTTYQIENGTSMATPAVTGLAAMLRAYNPHYTYADVIAAIKGGGRAVASLSGKTTTGKAVDAMKSLAYINQPTGLTATVQ